MKQSRMVMKFDPYDTLMIYRGNRTLIMFHVRCCSKHKLSTILIAKIANLARFVTRKKTLFVFFLIFYPYILFMTAIDYNNVLANTTHFTPLSPHNGHLCTTTTSFCPQGGCFGVV